MWSETSRKGRHFLHHFMVLTALIIHYMSSNISAEDNELTPFFTKNIL